MKHTDIEVNAVLKLKKDRQEAYGMEHDLVIVDGFKYRDGYKVPFILSNQGYFKASDFAKRIA